MIDSENNVSDFRGGEKQPKLRKKKRTVDRPSSDELFTIGSDVSSPEQHERRKHSRTRHIKERPGSGSSSTELPEHEQTTYGVRMPANNLPYGGAGRPDQKRAPYGSSITSSTKHAKLKAKLAGASPPSSDPNEETLLNPAGEGNVPLAHDLLPKRMIVVIFAFLVNFSVAVLNAMVSMPLFRIVSDFNESIHENALALAPANSTDNTLNQSSRLENSTEVNSAWTAYERSSVFSSFYYAYWVMTIAAGYFSQKIGSKYLLGVSMVFAAGLSILTPTFIRLGYAEFILCRILIGLGTGALYPAMLSLWAKWAPTYERSRLISVGVSAEMLGLATAMFFGGVFASQVDWMVIFYIFGVIILVWCGLWFYTICESPLEHETISEAELIYILSDRQSSKELQVGNGLGVPWKAIATSLPVWALTLTTFSERWITFFAVSNLPYYLSSRFEYTVEKAGIVMALPFLLMAIVVIMAGQIADRARRSSLLSPTWIRILFIVRSSQPHPSRKVPPLLIEGTLWLAAQRISDKHGFAVVMCVALCCNALARLSLHVNAIDLAPHYAGILSSLKSLATCLAGILTPLFNAVSLTETHSWNLSFDLLTLVLVIGALIYGSLGSGEVQSWAYVYSGRSTPVKRNSMDLARSGGQSSSEGFKILCSEQEQDD